MCARYASVHIRGVIPQTEIEHDISGLRKYYNVRWSRSLTHTMTVQILVLRPDVRQPFTRSAILVYNYVFNKYTRACFFFFFISIILRNGEHHARVCIRAHVRSIGLYVYASVSQPFFFFFL